MCFGSSVGKVMDLIHLISMRNDSGYSHVGGSGSNPGQCMLSKHTGIWMLVSVVRMNQPCGGFSRAVGACISIPGGPGIWILVSVVLLDQPCGWSSWIAGTRSRSPGQPVRNMGTSICSPAGPALQLSSQNEPFFLMV